MRPTDPANYETKPCPVCGTVFTALISKKRGYCSKRCGHQAIKNSDRNATPEWNQMSDKRRTRNLRDIPVGRWEARA